MKKGQNYIYTARTKMSKQIVELIFLSQECRALFDRYVDEMIQDDEIYKPCHKRSHIQLEKKVFKPKRKYVTKK